MKAILAIVLCLLVCTSAMTLKRRPITNAQKATIEKLRSGHTWGKIILDLAELSVKMDGDPLQELIDAIEKLIADLHDKLDQAKQDFNDRTEFHESEVQRLNDEIGEANADIAHTETFINNVLLVARATLQDQIEGLHGSIDANNVEMEEATEERNNAHAEYEAHVEELTQAVEALDESLELLSQITGPSASLAQVKSAKAAMQGMIKKLPRFVEAHRAKALLQLATGEFADSGALQNVYNMIEDIRTDCTNKITEAHAEEEQAVAEFDAFIAGKQQENVDFEGQIVRAEGELDATNGKIEENTNFLNARTVDLAEFNHALEAENADYEQDTETFNDLVAEFQRELDASNAALDVVNGGDFAGAIGERMHGNDVEAQGMQDV